MLEIVLCNNFIKKLKFSSHCIYWAFAMQTSSASWWFMPDKPYSLFLSLSDKCSIVYGSIKLKYIMPSKIQQGNYHSFSEPNAHWVMGKEWGDLQKDCLMDYVLVFAGAGLPSQGGSP